MFLSFFFFYCYGYHRDLHSFPTRRSSDLLELDLRMPDGFALKVLSQARAAVNDQSVQQTILRNGDVIGIGAVKIRFWLGDRKSTRLNSSHSSISYAVFCLKKKRNRFTGHI